MRTHTTQRVRSQGKFAKSKNANVPTVVKGVPRMVNGVPRVVNGIPRVVKGVSYVIDHSESNYSESPERQDLTYDNMHCFSSLDHQSQNFMTE